MLGLLFVTYGCHEAVAVTEFRYTQSCCSAAYHCMSSMICLRASRSFRPSLSREHRRELGVVEVAGDPGGIRLPGDAEGTPHHALELALHRREYIHAVLLELELCVEAHVFQVVLHPLCIIDEVAGEVSRDPELRLKTLGILRLRQQAFGLLGIVATVVDALAELLDGKRPFHLAAGDWWGRFTPNIYRVDGRLAVDGEGDGMSYADIVEGRYIGAHEDHLRYDVTGCEF
jgi:hypothetical protein